MNTKSAFWKKATVILILITVSYLINACIANDSLNIITTYLPGARGWSQTEIALPTTVGSWLSIPLVVLVGTLILKFGAFAVLRISYLIMGIGVLIVGISDVYALYFVSVVLIKLGSTASMFGNMSVCNNWFHSWRGRALGIVTIGAPLSTALGVPVLNWGTGAFGFQNTWIVFGGIGVIFSILLFFLGKSTPEEYGMNPDGAETAAAPESPDGTASGTWTFKNLAKCGTYWYIVASISIFGFVLSGTLAMFIAITSSAGVEMAAAISTLSIGTLIGIPLSFISGVIDDKFGTHKAAAMVWGFCFLLMVVMTLICNGITAIALLYIAGFCIGVVTGCFPNINASLKSYVFGRKAFVEVNRTSSVFENLVMGGSLTCFALVFDLTGSYAPIFIVLAVVMLILSIGMFFVKSLDSEQTNKT